MPVTTFQASSTPPCGCLKPPASSRSTCVHAAAPSRIARAAAGTGPRGSAAPQLLRAQAWRPIAREDPEKVFTDKARFRCDRPSPDRCQAQGPHQWMVKSIAGGLSGEKSAHEFPILRSSVLHKGGVNRQHKPWSAMAGQSFLGNQAEVQTSAAICAFFWAGVQWHTLDPCN